MKLDIDWMVGSAIDEISFSTPDTWWFRFSGGGVVRTESAWRIVIAGHIALTSEDHRQQFGLPAPIDAEAKVRYLLCARKIEAAEVREDTGDIVLRFESGERLEVIPLSSGYQSWDVTAPNGLRIIAQGGGNLVEYIPLTQAR